MKIAKVLYDGVAVYAQFKNDGYYLINGNIYGDFSVGERIIPQKLLCPVNPTKIVAIGVNYAEHAAEMGREVKAVPAIFIKPTTALLDPLGEIVYPKIATLVHYEGELAVVIGKDCRHVKAENAKDYILGYACANDVTERKIQRSDFQWTRGKGFDTFCPIGPHIATDINPCGLSISTVLNGKTVQQGNTADLIYDVYSLVEFISEFCTLKQGDVILTGTPKGVGELKVGDTVSVCIQDIGTLTNCVAAEKI